LTFVITGTLPKPRKEVEEVIESQGGHISSAVSSATNYLVAGENAGSKLQKAKALGVKTLSYDSLLKLIEEKTGHPKLF
jgi:DNA ligase (NAD+)